MPTFQQIYSQYSSARDKNLIGPDESISDYAKKALAFTGDPSYQSVAEGGTVGNWVRQRSADLTGFVNSGPVDEWLGEGTKFVGDMFGIDPAASRSVGESLPRMVVDYLPLAVGGALAPFTGGASLAPGLAMTSGLSAASGYEQSGQLSDAIIGGAAPYVGGKLSEIGGRAALNLVPKSQILQRLGFTGGTQVTGRALTAAEQAGMVANRGVTDAVAKATTKSFTELDKPLDKLLHYVGGEALANVGFTGLDIAQQGTDAVFNRDYLFANLVSNVPFAAADLAGSFANRPFGEVKYNLPEAPKVYESPGEQRAVEAAAMFQDLKDPVVFEQQRKKYGLDIADISMKTEELAAALNAKEIGLRVNETDFISKWNNYVTTTPEAQAAQYPTIKRGGAFGSELLGMKEVLGMQSLPIRAQEIVSGFKKQNNQLKVQVDGVVKNLGSPVKYTESLKVAVEKLNLDEFLQTPLEQRDYATALKGSWVSLDGADLVRDIHLVEAGKKPLRPDLYQEFINLFKGEPATFTPDKHMELLVAASLARGKTPKFAEMKQRAQEAIDEGQPDVVVVKEALKGMEEENKEVLAPFRQPVIPEDFQSGLEDTGALPPVDLIAGLAKKPAVATVSPEQPPVAEVNPVVEQAPQVQQTISDRLIASIPAKWDRVRDIVADFYRTGDDTQLQNIGIDADSLRIKTIATRNLETADPAYKQRIAEWNKAQTTAEAERRKILNTLPVKNETLTPDMQAVLKNNRVDQQKIPTEYLRAEDWSRVKDQDGNEYLIPMPDGEFQRAEDFARTLMKDYVSPEMLPESSKQLVSLAKMLGNPELWYAKLKEFVKGKSDALFARASAGAFDFGMREVQGGKLIRPGKPPLGTKDGWMTELEFRVNGGDLGPLQKDEVAFYKELVPEAFANDKVHLQKLWDGLGKVGEQVKVVTYGQDGQASESKRQLDRLTHEWFDNLTSAQQAAVDIQEFARQANKTVAEYLSSEEAAQKVLAPGRELDQAKVAEYLSLTNKVHEESKAGPTGPRATSYYNQISPFDTKRFPVVRVDVVLPHKARTFEEWRALYGLGSEESDRRKWAEAPKYTLNKEPLWMQDSLHENLPNTLGWAMVQIVPHPVTGEKVMFVGEAQSRWGQSAQKKAKEIADYKKQTFESSGIPDEMRARRVAEMEREVSGHPLLPIHQNLILKAVIKEAQKQGISKVAVSDGETAMMTEGHDKAAQKLEGEVGEWIAYYNGERPGSHFDLRSADKVQLMEQAKADGFNLDNMTVRQITEQDLRPVVSQEGGMRLAYDTTLPSIMSKLVGEGKMEDFGAHKNQRYLSGLGADGQRVTQENQYVAEQMLGDSGLKAEPAGSPVFRNPDGTPKTNILARVYDLSNPSPRLDTLFARNQGQVYGVAAPKSSKLFINSKAFQGYRASDRIASVFAHEQSHHSIIKAREGKFGPEAKLLADKVDAWVNAANPRMRKNVENVVVELHFGKDLARLDGVRDVLNNPNSEEWIANVMGAYAFGMVKSRAPKQAFAMLPKPIRDFADWMVGHFQQLLKGAQSWMRLSGGDYQGAKNVKDLFDTIRRSYRQAEWDAAQAEKFLDIEPSSMIERGNEFAFAQDHSKLGQVSDERVTDMTTMKKFVGQTWNKTIQPMHTLANAHEELFEPVMAVMNSHSDTTNTIADIFKVVAGELDGSDKLRMTNQAFKRVFSSEPLTNLFNSIQIRAEVAGKRMITADPQTGKEVFDMTALSPELRGRLTQFQPEAQKALVTMTAQAERANGLAQKKFLEASWGRSVSNFATLLGAKTSFNKADFKKAQPIAEGVFNDLKAANETVDQFQQEQLIQQAVSKLSALDETDRARAMEQAQEIFSQYADLKTFYDERPAFMSFRRYGNVRQKISKTGQPDDVIDADSNADLNEKLKFYKAQGWTEVGERQVVSKTERGQYNLNADLLKKMQLQERRFKEMIQESPIDKADKTAILSTKTASEVLISEINAKELFRPTKRRALSGDLERFDWWEQFQNYIPRAVASAQREALGAKVNHWMQNPALTDMRAQKDQFLALYEQSKQPDPEWARKLNKLNAVWHIGWNLPGHIAEVFQPMLSGVHELVAKGESLPGAMKLFWKAEKETMRLHGYKLKDKFFNPDKAKITVNGEDFEGMPAVWLKANGSSPEQLDIARMLHEKRDRIQKAPLSELRDFTGENHARLQDTLDGKRQRTLGEIIASPFTMYANAAMGFYSKFTQHNGVVTMVTAYRKFRKDGLSHQDAMQRAELFDLTVNNSGGRLERPEMFGKLGGAGHLPYGLTSYTRGRFSQLATYYRHGFDAKQFEGKLTGAEIKSAKKAFQTMILAQVGAAGVLGLPFVGAGIALMEELLGEDIKGKMINALDEVTNDPTLTRMFTHGMMSTMAESLGVPADLHSRFALSSFLGTNSYDGMSAKSFMGPSVAMLDSMFNLGGQIAQGESLEKSLTVAGPGGVKRLAESLSEDFQRSNPESNLAMSMLGFRSSQQMKRREWEQITRKQELETRKELTKSATEISNAMALSPQQGRIQLLKEAERLLPQGLDQQAMVKQRQQNVKDLINKVATIEADKVGPQDVRREISGRSAPMASQTAQAMGVQMPNPVELARALAQQKTRSQLGATVSQRPVRNAMLQEMQWGKNPWEF